MQNPLHYSKEIASGTSAEFFPDGGTAEIQATAEAANEEGAEISFRVTDTVRTALLEESDQRDVNQG